MTEEWKWIKGYEGLYQISNFGRVKSFHKKIDGEIRSVKHSGGWYLTIPLRGNGVRCTARIHRLVYKTFIGDIPPGYEIHHKDGNKQNNNVENLEALSKRDHCLETIKQHPHMLDGMIAYNQGRRLEGWEKRAKKSLPYNVRFPKGQICQFSLDGEYIASYHNACEASRATGVCARNILQVACKTPFNDKGGIRKQAGGFVWKFEKEVM